MPWILALCALPLALRAAPPVLEHLYPAGGAPRSTQVVAVTGKFEPWPVRVWIEGSGVGFVARTNTGEFEVTVAPEASPGPRLVRLLNDEGASEPRCFVVGVHPEVSDREPNDAFAEPQGLEAFPVTVNGRLDKNGDVDSFAIPVRAGQWIDARVDAFTLMSEIDAVLRLVNGRGAQRAWNHDFAALDPRLTWQADRDETVVLQIFGFKYPADASVRLSGGKGAVYRLHLAVGEPPAGPPCAPRREQEPNNTIAAAQELDLPIDLAGVIGDVLDEDRFRVALAAGDALEVGIEAAEAGSPLDAWLKIEDASGKRLLHIDDTDGSRDPSGAWTAPGDGAYVLAVGSLLRRGGDAHQYRLRARRAGPECEARVTSSAYVLKAGETNRVKLAITRRHGHTNQVEAAFEGLPPGVTGKGVTAGAGEAEVALELVASADAPAYQGPLRIVVSDPAAAARHAVTFERTSRGVDNGVPQGYYRLLVDRAEPWLTVIPDSPAAGAP